MRSVHTLSAEIPVKMRPIQKQRLSGENNIKTDLKEIGSIGGPL
jgi:hypothetical protein